MFKSLDSLASVVGFFMYPTISKFKQVLRSRKGLGKVSTTTLVFTWWSKIMRDSHATFAQVWHYSESKPEKMPFLHKPIFQENYPNFYPQTSG